MGVTLLRQDNVLDFFHPRPGEGGSKNPALQIILNVLMCSYELVLVLLRPARCTAPSAAGIRLQVGTR